MQGIPIIITGAAGTGQSWLATALGYQACMLGNSVLYYNMSKMIEEIALARIQGAITRFFEKLAKAEMLIIDDLGVKVLDGQQLLDFMEIMEDRHGRMATIIVSQLSVANWYDVMKSNTTAADAILDRIVHSATRFELKGESMRRKKSYICIAILQDSLKSERICPFWLGGYRPFFASAEEFQMTKFFCKTDMDMKAIQAEEADYANYSIPKFYQFKSRDARERILYANFNQVERDVKNMVAAIFEKEKAKNPQGIINKA